MVIYNQIVNTIVRTTVTNWTYTWETGKVHTRTKYKAGTGQEIEADIGVHIGLRGINITLKGRHFSFMEILLIIQMMIDGWLSEI